MKLFENVANKLLKEDFEQDGGFYVYHGTRDSALDGISRLGFERFFTSTNGGNLYGAGLYTTYKLSTQGQNAHGVYGQLMFKMRVKSLKNFIIYDPEIAMKVYGKVDVDSQLRSILTPEQYTKMRNECDPSARRWGAYDYNKLINSKNDEKSSVCALDMCRYFRDYDPEGGYKINGYIFKGNHDGYVCFLRDFKNAYPVEVSNDCGRTWKKFEGSKTMQEFGIDDVDLRFQLGKHNYKLMQELDEVPFYFINGFAKVRKNGKYNFLYRKKPLAQGVISPVWFDNAPETFTNRGTCNVIIEGETFILKLDQKTNLFYVYSVDGKYLCRLDSLDKFLSTINNQEFDDDEEF